MDMNIVILATDCESTAIIYNALKTDYNISKIIIEKKIAHSSVLKNRIKKLGFIKVMGQVLFLLCVTNMLKLYSANRITDIKKKI